MSDPIVRTVLVLANIAVVVIMGAIAALNIYFGWKFALGSIFGFALFEMSHKIKTGDWYDPT